MGPSVSDLPENMTDCISVHTMERAIQCALKDRKISDGAEFRNVAQSPLSQFSFWLLRCLFGVGIEEWRDATVAEKREALKAQSFAIVRDLLNCHLDADGELTVQCQLKVGDHLFILQQDGAHLTLQDHARPAEVITIRDVTFRELKNKVFFAYLDESGAPLREFDGLLNFKDIDFAGRDMDSTDLVAVLKNNGKQDDITVSAVTNPDSPDFSRIRFDKPMARQLIRLHDNPKSVLTAYLEREKNLGHVPIDMYGFDLADMDLSDIDLTGPGFNWTPRPSTLSREQAESIHRSAATKIQTCFRGHRIFHKKESEEAELSVLESIPGYRVPDPDRALGFRLARRPPAITGGTYGIAKKVTHADDDFIILTVNPRVPATFLPAPESRDTVRFVRGLNLPTLVWQYRINRKQFLSKNMGKADLLAQLSANKYKYSHDHYLAAARDLQKLHGHNIVHRDIKPENMILKDGVMHFLDLDFLERVDRLTIECGTYRYMHENLRPKMLPNAIKIDQHSFFLTMMTAFLRRRPSEEGMFSVEQIKKFVNTLSVPEVHLEELGRFIYDPGRYSLSQPLPFYLNPPQP